MCPPCQLQTIIIRAFCHYFVLPGVGKSMRSCLTLVVQFLMIRVLIQLLQSMIFAMQRSTTAFLCFGVILLNLHALINAWKSCLCMNAYILAHSQMFACITKLVQVSVHSSFAIFQYSTSCILSLKLHFFFS